MHALVTGAGGFLGQHIADQLVQRGDWVRALVRRPSPTLARLGVETVQGDVRDREAVQRACGGVDVVFHAAGIAGIWGPWEHYFGINTVGTRNIIAGCRRAGVPRLVYTSSPSVTFDGGDQEGVDESQPYPHRWLCHYSHTKALAEQEVLAANDGGGLRTCALRPHLIWGPGDPHLVSRLVDWARRGRLVRVGAGRNQIDITYVANAAEAHLRAADHLQPGSPACGRAYYLSQGEPVNCWQWIDAIINLAGLPPVRRRISFRTAWVTGALLETMYWLCRRRDEPRMTRFLAAQMAKSHYFDIRRARADFGYRPSESTDSGMQKLAAWLRGGSGG